MDIGENREPAGTLPSDSRWAQAVTGLDEDAQEAWRELSASYWYCIYVWWRRAGMEPAEAAQATLACLSRWRGDQPPRAGDSGAERMRTWLAARLTELAAQETELEIDAAAVTSIDAGWAEQRYAAEPPGEPEAIFARRWALTLLEFGAEFLQREYAARGEEALVAELFPFAGFEPADDGRYAAAARRLQRSSGAMRKAVYDFRTRQREILRALVADTVVAQADTDNELITLLAALDPPGAEGGPMPSRLQGLRPDEIFARAMQSVRMSGGAAAGHKWQPPSEAEVARLFPQYEILGLVGRGGMGAVYKARQIELDRIIAIKLLPLEVSVDPEFAARFRREARAMAKLSHPHIISVYDFGTTGEGHLYFAMEFVEGSNLHDMIRQVGLEPAQALVLGAQVCTALAYAHEKGIVHRDMKPANVMVDLAGQAKVADFGLARLVDLAEEEPGQTMTGTIIGTPDYMAPEQKHGEQVDLRADVYSVGVMLYEMLCRETPHGAFDLPSRRIGCDPRIDKVVLKAMQQAPDRRYQNTQEMRAAIATVLTSPANRQRPGAAATPPVKRPPPRHGAALLYLTGLLLAAAAGVLAYWKWDSPRIAERPASPSTPAANPVAGTPAEAAKTSESPAPQLAPAIPPEPAAAPTPPEPAAAPDPTPVPAPQAEPATPAPTPASSTGKWIAEQEPLWQAAYAAEVTAPFEKGVADLRKQYVATVDGQLAALAKAAKLEDAVAFRAERERLASGDGVPPQDEANVPLTLKTLRTSYRTTFARLDQDRFARAKTLHARYDESLARSQAALTQKQRLDEALELKAVRERLSSAWLVAPTGVGAPAAVAPEQRGNPPKPMESGRAAPFAANLSDKYTNTLGMRMVKVPGTAVLFCIHETRRRDYAAYAAAVPGVDGTWKRVLNFGTPISPEDNDPVVGVSWSEAVAFCTWLSEREGLKYRLPTDEEWSTAAGLGRLEKHGKGITPEMLHNKEKTHVPWDGPYPPRKRDLPGNFADTALHEIYPTAPYFEGYTDGFATTAPVMSFKPNKFGLYDMAGNLREHVEEWWNGDLAERTARGTCWLDSGLILYTSFRFKQAPSIHPTMVGFRVVVEERAPPRAVPGPVKPAPAVTPPPAVAKKEPGVKPFGQWRPLFGDAFWKESQPAWGREAVDGRVHMTKARTMASQPAADGAIRVRVQRQPGSQSAGLLARFTMEGGSYKAELNPDGTTVMLSYFLPGNTSGPNNQRLGQFTLPKRLQPGESILLELRLEGDRLSLLADGVVILEARDSRAPGPGQWGIIADDGWFQSAEVQTP